MLHDPHWGLDWSPKVLEQLIGRLSREGQSEQITAIYLNADEGSDPPMVELLGLKSSQASGIIDPGRQLEARHSDKTRIQALAEQFLSKIKQNKPLGKAGQLALFTDEQLTG